MQIQDQINSAAQAVTNAQSTLTQDQGALTAAQAPGSSASAQSVQQLVQQVQTDQQAVTDALRQQKELQLQMLAAAEQKKHDRLAAIQRDNLAKQLYELQQALLKHPAEWKSMGTKVEKVLKNFGVRMTPAGQEWASMFANGLRQGIPAVEQAAHALANAVDKYMPHSPAKVGPLSYDAARSGKAWADRFAEGFAGSFPDVNGMTAAQMMKLTAGGGGNAAAGSAPLIGEVHVHNDTDVEVMASRVQRRLAFEMR